MGKKGGDQEMEVTAYRLSVLFAFCHGPIDEVRRIIIMKKEAWRGSVVGQRAFGISKKDLFGGEKKQGGVEGTVVLLPGELDQVVPSSIAANVNRSALAMPAMRGVGTIFFGGSDISAFAPDSGPNGQPGQKAFNRFVGKGANGPSLDDGQPIEEDTEIPEALPNDTPGFVPLTGNESYGLQGHRVEGPNGFLWQHNNPYLPETEVEITRLARCSLPDGLRAVYNLVPEALIGEPEEPDDEDDEPDAYNDDPLNGYYIDVLPSREELQTARSGRVERRAEDDYARSKESPIGGEGVFGQVVEKYIYKVRNGRPVKQKVAMRNYGRDSNPAHLIMEYMQDQAWGMNEPVDSFDGRVWTEVAQHFYDRRVGMSILWNDQTKIESMVSEAIDHVQAAVYVNPKTGLWEIKLIRGDYVADELPVINEDNADFRSFKRKAWGETTNEMIVTWTNPENEKESTVTLQDLGNIAVQGQTITDNRNYYGFRNASLAYEACARDLRSASYPTATIEAELDRSFWDILPGSVYRVRWGQHGIHDVVFRVMNVDYGKIGSGFIKVTLVEDVFGLPMQNYQVAPPAPPTPDVSRVDPLDYHLFMSVPYQLAGKFGLGIEPEFPDAAVMILGACETFAVFGFEVFTEEPAADGSMQLTSQGTKNVSTFARLPEALEPEATSRIPLFAAQTRRTSNPTQGGLAIIGHSDRDQEIAMLMSYNEGTGFEVRRGMLDTVPQAWPAGTPVWIIDFGRYQGFDSTLRQVGVETDYTLLTETDDEQLEIEYANEVSFAPGDRYHAPARPANCAINGESWSGAAALDFSGEKAKPETVTATWANRNRLLEDSVFRAWTDGSVTPEPGQTTTLRVLNAATREEVSAHPGLEGTSAELPGSAFRSGRNLVVFESEREGFTSWQAVEIEVIMPFEPGYGYSYGKLYGE